MYCPVCGSEYRANFTECSDCQVALVADPPGGALPAEGFSKDGEFVMMWSGSDPRKHLEICETLGRERILAKTIRGEDHLIYATTNAGSFAVYVPRAMAARAREVLHAADDLDESYQQAVESGALEIPAEDDDLDLGETRRSRGSRGKGHPEDATVEVWSGEDADTGDMIRTCLRENGIYSCRGPEENAEPDADAATRSPGAAGVFVLPGDERRAKEIVREIVEGAPPE